MTKEGAVGGDSTTMGILNTKSPTHRTPSRLKEIAKDRQRHTDIAEDDREEDESVEGTPEQHQHVHAEVVDVEEPGLGKEKDKDTEELGDGDSTEDRGTHVVQS